MDKSRVEPTIFFIEKISFSLKLFSGHFYGQSFIKTVRGPLKDNIYMIYLCCYVSSRRLSDVGSTMTNCTCILLIGHIWNQSRCIVLTLCMLVSYADNICKWLIPVTYIRSYIGHCLYPDQTLHNVGLSGHYDGIHETVL